MINDWKELLQDWGFEKMGRRQFVRISKPISVWIREVPPRVGGIRVRVLLPVEIDDPFCAEDAHKLHEFGDLTPDGICIRPVGLTSPFWIAPGQADAALGVLRGCLDGWMNYWTNPLNLINHLEKPVAVVMTRPVKRGPGWQTEFGAVLPSRRSPNDNYQLSLLYQHVDQYKQALAYANKVFKFYQSMPDNTYEG